MSKKRNLLHLPHGEVIRLSTFSHLWGNKLKCRVVTTAVGRRACRDGG